MGNHQHLMGFQALNALAIRVAVSARIRRARPDLPQTDAAAKIFFASNAVSDWSSTE
jgi:hypothetical protein